MNAEKAYLQVEGPTMKSRDQSQSQKPKERKSLIFSAVYRSVISIFRLGLH